MKSISYGATKSTSLLKRTGSTGFEIKNFDTPWDLYFNCFYFDSMDLSIDALTPVVNRGQFAQDFMIAGRGGTASISYGPLAIAPVAFDPVPQGRDVTAGFFKFYFSTKHAPPIL
ncbi:hypothetical protein BKA70DRAFT_1462636 [Coprinopsis sp. MPI-PUGE-AT-0042]|nr:hypothetical protein BKA70DRAFT_1462636 [Coprinopsis sp. MPI-PUGE-AT-0042]